MRLNVVWHRMGELTSDEPRHEEQDDRPALKEVASHRRRVSPQRRTCNQCATRMFSYSGTVYFQKPGVDSSISGKLIRPKAMRASRNKLVRRGLSQADCPAF